MGLAISKLLTEENNPEKKFLELLTTGKIFGLLEEPEQSTLNSLLNLIADLEIRKGLMKKSLEEVDKISDGDNIYKTRELTEIKYSEEQYANLAKFALKYLSSVNGLDGDDKALKVIRSILAKNGTPQIFLACLGELNEVMQKKVLTGGVFKDLVRKGGFFTRNHFFVENSPMGHFLDVNQFLMFSERLGITLKCLEEEPYRFVAESVDDSFYLVNRLLNLRPSGIEYEEYLKKVFDRITSELGANSPIAIAANSNNLEVLALVVSKSSSDHLAQLRAFFVNYPTEIQMIFNPNSILEYTPPPSDEKNVHALIRANFIRFVNDVTMSSPEYSEDFADAKEKYKLLLFDQKNDLHKRVMQSVSCHLSLTHNVFGAFDKFKQTSKDFFSNYIKDRVLVAAVHALVPQELDYWEKSQSLTLEEVDLVFNAATEVADWVFSNAATIGKARNYAESYVLSLEDSPLSKESHLNILDQILDHPVISSVGDNKDLEEKIKKINSAIMTILHKNILTSSSMLNHYSKKATTQPKTPTQASANKLSAKTLDGALDAGGSSLA